MNTQRAGLIFLMVFMMVAAFVAFITLTGKPAINPFKRPDTNDNITIGGPFTLINQEGKEVKDSDFEGKYRLVYFGYTFCPDVCPADLLTLSATMQALGNDANKIAPIFITIDPERDTIEQLQQYMQNFDPRITALTGSKEAIAQAANGYKVYYQEVEDQKMTGYLMDHSAIIYLMDPRGRYLTHFPHGTNAELIVEKIKHYW